MASPHENATDFPVDKLRELSARCRADILSMTGSAEPSLRLIDVMIALFFREMKIDPKNPGWAERDRFILSQGQAAPALYAVLACLGALPEEELKTFGRLDSRLQRSPDRRLLPFAEASTQAPGQGLSVALGMAMGLRLDGNPARVYCAIGAEESREGQIWEAAELAPRLGLNNLTVFLDRGAGSKWSAFGWKVEEVDGHEFERLLPSLARARQEKGHPTLIIHDQGEGRG